MAERGQRGGSLGDRSTVELMTLMLTAAVCLCIIGMSVGLTVLEIVDPSIDTAAAFAVLSNVLSAVLGALLGLLAGRSERGMSLHRRPSGEDDGL